MDWDPEMCRICLTSSTTHVDLSSPFMGNKVLMWLDILNLCTCLGAKKDDNLPKNLCQVCLIELEGAFKFYEKARKADQLLRSHTENTFESVIRTKEITAKYAYSTSMDPDDITDENIMNPNYSDQSKNDFVKVELYDLVDIQSEIEDTIYNSTKISPENCDDGLEEKFCDLLYNKSDSEDNDDTQDSNLKNQDMNITESRDIFEMKLNETRKIAENVIKDKKCPTCDMSFERISSLEMHINFKRCDVGNDFTKVVECDLCGKPIKRSSLSKHIRRHRNEGRSFLCNACPKRFFTNDTLRNHLKTHDENRERRFPCTICPKAFFDKSSLTIHERWHTGIKPFECPDCKKSFFTQNALAVHSIVHNREVGKHMCNICSNKFPSNRQLVVHMRFHTGIYPFKCDLCERSFAVKSHLDDHVARHKGIIFNCPHCQKQYKHRGSLRAHLVKHRSRMPHICPTCNKGYRTPSTLKQHMQSHQKVKKELE